MTEDTDAAGEPERKLIFDTDPYSDGESYERIAEGLQRRGDRKAVYTYDLDHSRIFPLLRVHVRYYDGDRMTDHTTRTYRVEDRVVRSAGQDLIEFVEADFDDSEAFAAGFESAAEGRATDG